MPILNYTTKVPASQTVLEIQNKLAHKNARRISVEYDNEHNPTSIDFEILVCEQPVRFRLPCNVDGVQRAMKRDRAAGRDDRNRVRRVAWRIVKNWVDAQLAMIEANQVEMAEVFLPYAIDNRGETMFALFKESKQKQLTAGSNAQ